MAKKPSPTPPDTPDSKGAENEVLREVRRQNELAAAKARNAKRSRGGASGDQGDKKGLDWKAAAGLGIGSAALLAALLYSKSDKK